MDDLVNVQLEFVHKLMEDTKLDQENEQLKNWIAQLMGQFGLYACDKIVRISKNKFIFTIATFHRMSLRYKRRLVHLWEK